MSPSRLLKVVLPALAFLLWLTLPVLAGQPQLSQKVEPPFLPTVTKPVPPRAPQVKGASSPSEKRAEPSSPVPSRAEASILPPEFLAKVRAAQSPEITGVDFHRLAKSYPTFKTIILLAFDRPLDLDRLIRLKLAGVYPVNGSLIDYLDRTHGFFHTKAARLKKLKPGSGFPGLLAVVPLARFQMNGLYRVHFKIVEKGFQGPLGFSITTPRESFGKRIIRQSDHLYPRRPFEIRIDEAGNRWLLTDLEQAGEGKTLKLDSHVVYRVDVAELLRHAISTTPFRPAEPVPPQDQAAAFLTPGEKITSLSQEVAGLAEEIFGEERVPRRLWVRIQKYIKANIPYDHKKRALFFGGRKVYKAMAEMYDPPAVLLARKLGACPETCLLEASLFRAVGVPARTAGRWGHFFTEIYLPGRGWVSTSVTPTGLPLVRDKDAEHLPFVTWDREVEVQTTRWSGEVRISLGDLP